MSRSLRTSRPFGSLRLNPSSPDSFFSPSCHADPITKLVYSHSVSLQSLVVPVLPNASLFSSLLVFFSSLRTIFYDIFRPFFPAFAYTLRLERRFRIRFSPSDSQISLRARERGRIEGRVEKHHKIQELSTQQRIESKITTNTLKKPLKDQNWKRYRD